MVLRYILERSTQITHLFLTNLCDSVGAKFVAIYFTDVFISEANILIVLAYLIVLDVRIIY